MKLQLFFPHTVLYTYHIRAHCPGSECHISRLQDRENLLYGIYWMVERKTINLDDWKTIRRYSWSKCLLHLRRIACIRKLCIKLLKTNTTIQGTLCLSQLEKPLNNVMILKSLIIVQIAKSIQSADTIYLNVSAESILALSLSETHLCYFIFDSKVSFTTALFINALMKLLNHTVCVLWRYELWCFAQHTTHFNTRVFPKEVHLNFFYEFSDTIYT